MTVDILLIINIHTYLQTYVQKREDNQGQARCCRLTRRHYAACAKCIDSDIVKGKMEFDLRK